MTKKQQQQVAAIKADMLDAWRDRNPQTAANVIANAGALQHVAMDAAAAAGFIPEYYANSIRVYLPE